MKKVTLLSMILIFALTPFLLEAGTLKGVNMEDSIKMDDQDLVLNGMALRRKFVFKVYVAGLYLPQKEKSGEKILAADETRRMIMHFLRGVGPKKINGAWYDGLEDNTPNASGKLKQQFKDLAAMMEEVEDGDRMVFTYVPNKGTEVVVKKKVKGTIPGKPFADALFSCWIGKKPGPGEGFKKDLLGK